MARVKSKIRVEVEIDVGVWDGKATFDGLHSQIVKEGTQIVRSIFEAEQGCKPARGRVVGNAHVICVMVEDEKGG